MKYFSNIGTNQKDTYKCQYRRNEYDIRLASPLNEKDYN